MGHYFIFFPFLWYMTLLKHKMVQKPEVHFVCLFVCFLEQFWKNIPCYFETFSAKVSLTLADNSWLYMILKTRKKQISLMETISSTFFLNTYGLNKICLLSVMNRMRNLRGGGKIININLTRPPTCTHPTHTHAPTQTSNFGTLQDRSLKINSLPLNNCFRCTNV